MSEPLIPDSLLFLKIRYSKILASERKEYVL